MEVILVLFVIIPIAVIIYKYMTTPVKRWSEFFTRETLEEKAERLSKKYEVQIVEGHKNKKRHFVQVIASAIFLLFVYFIIEKAGINGGCDDFLGIPGAVFSILMLCYGFTSLLFLVSIFICKSGYDVYKTGYLPLVFKQWQFGDKLQVRYKHSKLVGFVVMLFPLLSMYAIVLGHDVYNKITKDQSFSEFQETVRISCDADKGDDHFKLPPRRDVDL